MARVRDRDNDDVGGRCRPEIVFTGNGDRSMIGVHLLRGGLRFLLGS
jgi:hypothetical protein